MDRVGLHAALKAATGLEVYPINDRSGGRSVEWLVLKSGGGVGSTTSESGMWEFWTVFVYTAKNSILKLDQTIQAIITWATTSGVGVEFTGNETPDFYDEELSALMRSIQIRIPKEV